jgi:hypothetical protein
MLTSVVIKRDAQRRAKIVIRDEFVTAKSTDASVGVNSSRAAGARLEPSKANAEEGFEGKTFLIWILNTKVNSLLCFSDIP